ETAVGDDVDVAPTGLVEVVTPGRGHVGDRGRHRCVDAQGGPGAVGGAAAEADQDPGGSGAHEVQGGGIGARSPDDHRDVELVDEPLEVERLVVAGDVLGGHRGAADVE